MAQKSKKKPNIERNLPAQFQPSQPTDPAQVAVLVPPVNATVADAYQSAAECGLVPMAYKDLLLVRKLGSELIGAEGVKLAHGFTLVAIQEVLSSIQQIADRLREATELGPMERIGLGRALAALNNSLNRSTRSITDIAAAGEDMGANRNRSFQPGKPIQVNLQVNTYGKEGAIVNEPETPKLAPN